MKMKTRKIAITALTAAFMLSAGVAMASETTVSANAASPLEMIGASVRLDENAGIRFAAKLNGEADETSKYYVMIVPYSWVDTEYDLSVNTTDFYDEFVTKGGRVVDESIIIMESVPAYDAKEQATLVKGTISSVKYNNINNQFFGVAYEEKADGTRVYASNQEKGVRSCTYVAGAALNSGDYADDTAKTAALKGMVNKAYNKVVLGTSEADYNAAVTAGTVTEFVSNASIDGAYVSLVNNGSTLNVKDYLLNYESALDLPIKWGISAYETDASLASIDEDGNFTAAGDKGLFFVNATIAGTKTGNRLFTLNSAIEGQNTLNDFSAESYNADKGMNVSYFNANWDENLKKTSNSAYYSDYLAEYTDANQVSAQGIAYIKPSNWDYTASNLNYGVCIRTELTKSELAKLNIESITIRYLVKSATDTNIQVNFFRGGWNTVTADTWQTLTITKAQLLATDNDNKYVTGTTTEERWAAWVNEYSHIGAGRLGFMSRTKDVVVYMDSISYTLAA